MSVRCPGCRTRRASFSSLLKHVNATGHRVCGCGGYEHVHRPGSPYCEANPVSALLMADRYGADDAAIKRCAEYLAEENEGDGRVLEKINDMLKAWHIATINKEK